MGNCNEPIYGESENKRQNVPSVFAKDRLISLDQAFELRPDMKSCNQHDDMVKGIIYERGRPTRTIAGS